MTKKNLILNLNQDLKAEYSAVLQYLHHSYLILGPERDGIISELLEHAQDEYEHAQILGKEIVRLGGVPEIDLDKNPTVLENKKMLAQDLRWEEQAISDYRKRIKEAESVDELGLANKLEEILGKEEEHAQDIIMILKKS